MTTSREHFLAERRKGIGGSDIGAILGLSKFKSRVDVWLDKTGRAPDLPSTIPQRFGIYAEQFVAEEYAAKTGRRVVRFTKQLQHPEHPFLLGNVDRLVIPEGAKVAAHLGEIRTDRGVECKAVSAYAGGEWGDDDSDEVPPYYLTQCAWYRLLTRCRYWDLAALIGNHRIEVYTLPRDRDLEALLVARGVEFWRDYVLTDTPPEPASEADIAKLYPDSQEGKKAQADAETLEALEQVKAAGRDAEAAINRQEEARKLVKLRMGDASELVGPDGKPLATWRTNKASKKTNYEAAFVEALGNVPPELREGVRAELIAKHSRYEAGARPFKVK